MKPKFFLLLCIAVAFIVSDCEESPTDNPVVAKKKVKTESQYVIGHPNGIKELDTRITYDTSGNIIEKYYENDFTQRFENYEYDSNGRRISGTFRVICDSVEHHGTHVYEYDAHGNLIKETEYWELEVVETFKYEYDANNILVKRIHYYVDSTWSSWVIYEYNAKGYKIKSTNYNNEGRIVKFNIYKYDSKGRLIEEDSIEADGITLEYKNIYIYNSNDELIEELYYDKKGFNLYTIIFERTYYE